MTKRILLNAFHMNCVVHQSPGLWTQPGDKMESYKDLETWIELAKLLERGRFDALFLADVVGVYDVFNGDRNAAVSSAAQIPVNDPALLIPAMAAATRDLGFAWTSSVLQSHPFAFAQDLKFLAYVKVITGGTEAEARRKYESFLAHISYDASMALLSGWSGIDFGQFEPEQPLEYVETNAVRTLVHGFTAADPSRKWTMRDLARYVGIGGAGPVIVGAPEQVADELQKWIDVGVDGFNLAYAVTPGSFVDFVDGVVPVLQRRGLVQTAYEDGTLREKIYGRGQRRLLDGHPGSSYRRPSPPSPTGSAPEVRAPASAAQ